MSFELHFESPQSTILQNDFLQRQSTFRQKILDNDKQVSVCLACIVAFVNSSAGILEFLGVIVGNFL